MHYAERYKVDGEKIETVEDVAKIIEALDIRLAPDHESFEELEPYLTEVGENTNRQYD